MNVEQRYRFVYKPIVFAASLIPFAWLLCGAVGWLGVSLGADPVKTFELFLGLGYAAFHLARAEGVTLPDGRGIFAGFESADATLRRAGLTPGPTRWLDKPARVSLTVYARPAASDGPAAST